MNICPLLVGMINKIQDIFTGYLTDKSVSISFSKEMWEAAEAIVDCRTPAMETHYELCPDGHGFYVLYDSCKHRGCPQCQKVGNLKWLHKKKQVLLPGSHLHLVFKLPASLTPLWMYNRRQVGDSMFAAVADGFKKLQKNDGVERGILLVFHSHGKRLSYHPHVHCLVSFGGFTGERKWVEKRLTFETLMDAYKNELRKQLLNLLEGEGFQDPPGVKCPEELVIRGTEKGNIFESRIYKTGDGVLVYLAQHIRSGVIDEKDIVSYNEYEVVFKQGRGKDLEIVKLKREDFIVRYLNHIPPKDFHIVRNMGLYANRNAKDMKEYKRLLGLEVDGSEPEIPKRKCPECGKAVVPVADEDKKKIQKWLVREYGKSMEPGYGTFIRWKLPLVKSA